MLERLTDDVWTEQRPLRFFGLETGTRMTIVRLASGGLFVHSPVALDAELRAAVDALGPVTAVVAPSRFHHLYVGEWAAAYPTASVSGCPGLEKKRKDIAWSRILGDEPAAEWQGELDQVFFGARSLENEVVFFQSRQQDHRLRRLRLQPRHARLGDSRAPSRSCSASASPAPRCSSAS